MNISSAAQERRSLDVSRLTPLTLAVVLIKLEIRPTWVLIATQALKTSWPECQLPSGDSQLCWTHAFMWQILMCNCYLLGTLLRLDMQTEIKSRPCSNSAYKARCKVLLWGKSRQDELRIVKLRPEQRVRLQGKILAAEGWGGVQR